MHATQEYRIKIEGIYTVSTLRLVLVSKHHLALITLGGGCGVKMGGGGVLLIQIDTYYLVLHAVRDVCPSPLTSMSEFITEAYWGGGGGGWR